MAGTSSSELVTLVNSLGLNSFFLGVFDKHFPGFIDLNRIAYAIVNTGDYASGGVHWIAFAYDPNGRIFYIFDPFGWSKKDLWKFYKFQYDRIVKNTALSNGRCVRLVKSIETVQCPCSAACGLFCLLFLSSFYHYRHTPMCNNPIIDIVNGVCHNKMKNPVSIKVLHCNQEKLYDWLYINSVYFRDNEYVIKQNTKINSMFLHYLFIVGFFF